MSLPSRAWMHNGTGWVSREPTCADKTFRMLLVRWLGGETTVDQRTGKEREARLDEIVPAEFLGTRHDVAEQERTDMLEAARKAKETE